MWTRVRNLSAIAYFWLALSVHILVQLFAHGLYYIPLFDALSDISGVTLVVLTGLLLHVQVRAYQRTSEQLQQAHRDMEQRVEDRTTALAEANEALLYEIAERTLTENELRLGRDFAERLLATAPVIILVLDQDGCIVRFNHYMEEISGYRLNEVHTQDGVRTFVPESERERIRSCLHEVVNGRTVHEVMLLMTKTGQTREVEWTGTPLRDDKGHYLGVLALGRDVTDERSTAAQLSSLIKTTQDAVITIDRQGRIVLFNPAAENIFGYGVAEVRGQPVSLLMPEPYASEHPGYIQRYEETRVPRAIGLTRTVAARRKNGEIFPIEVSVTEISVPGDTLYGAFIRDISDKVRLQERLVERERLAAIGTTAATFAHEVGNPLNSMFMATQLLERALAKNPSVEQKTMDTLRNVTKEMKRLNVLLHEFRALARRQALNVRQVSLPGLMTDLLRGEAPLYHASGVQVEADIPTDLPEVEADPEKLKQAFLNLCKNAVEAMPEGGTLTLKARQEKDAILLEIGDTGAGIAPGVQIFEPFVTTKRQGTGLGLTVVRQIVAAHKGTVTYRSTPGEGTLFTVELPVEQR
ncbi:MAG: PAS domain S-box protein [Candidatus Binatia bacterium]